MDYDIRKVGAKSAKKAQAAHVAYTELDIQSKLEGYINVHSLLWDRIPPGSHVRYFKKEGSSRANKFRPGGFVKNHYADKNGKKFLMLETVRGGDENIKGYKRFPVAYEDIEEIWKKYDRDVFIEMHLISASLAQKKRQIDDLTARVTALEKRVGLGAT